MNSSFRCRSAGLIEFVSVDWFGWYSLHLLLLILLLKWWTWSYLFLVFSVWTVMFLVMSLTFCLLILLHQIFVGAPAVVLMFAGARHFGLLLCAAAAFASEPIAHSIFQFVFTIVLLLLPHFLAVLWGLRLHPYVWFPCRIFVAQVHRLLSIGWRLRILIGSTRSGQLLIAPIFGADQQRLKQFSQPLIVFCATQSSLLLLVLILISEQPINFPNSPRFH